MRHRLGVLKLLLLTPLGGHRLAVGWGLRGTWAPGAGAQGPGEGHREPRPEADDAAPSAGTGVRRSSAGRSVRGPRRGVGLRAECADSPSGRGLSLDGTGRGRGRGHARPSGRLRPRSPGAPLCPRCGGRLRP